MSLEIIGAGLGRTATLSLKFALEMLDLGRCYHMTELYGSGRTSLPLWVDAIGGNPNWSKIFSGFTSTTDYPGSCFYRELMDFYPDAKVILTVRDPDSWFDSVSETIFSSHRDSNLFGASGKAFSNFVRSPFAEKISDRAFMTGYFKHWNQSVIDHVPKERLLMLTPGDGWNPLCEFLGKKIPAKPYPRVHERSQRHKHENSQPAKDAQSLERRMLDHLNRLRLQLEMPVAPNP